jgi:predicted transposase YdaD
VGNEAYSLYSLLPIIDRKERKQKQEKYLRKCVRAIKDTPIDIEEKREIAFRAEILAGLVFQKPIIESIFSEVINMLRIEDSVIYQDVIAKGMEKGVKEGMEKGMEKGKSKGKAEVIIKLLKKKFNTLPAAYEEKLLKAKEQIIDNITEDMFDIDKIEDLDKYF